MSRDENDHWFCPRHAVNEPQAVCFDEDVISQLDNETETEKTARLAKVKAVLDFRQNITLACQIYAFDGDEAVGYSDQLLKAFKVQLTRCNICVREFHRFRTELHQTLEAEYDSEQVEAFMTIYDQVNLGRITAALDSAKDTLLDTAPDERTIHSLQNSEVFGLFEAMHCVPLLRNDLLLADHFDQPFRLVQAKAKISLPEYTPALTAFLFSDNEDRTRWALRGWKRFKRNITGPEFEWTVRDSLKSAMVRVNINALERDFMPTFWQAVHSILQKVDQPMIAQHIRANDIDIPRLALEHLQVDSPCFVDLLGCLTRMLLISPADTWDSLGTIPPQAVVEQIFNSPSFQRLLMTTSPELETCLRWIEPLLGSIKIAAMPATCRAITHQLMTRFTASTIPKASREICQRHGEQALIMVLDAMLGSSGASIAALLDMLRSHILALLDELKVAQGQKESAVLQPGSLPLQIVQKTLALDCYRLSLDREALAAKKPIHHDISTVTGRIWTELVKNVRSANVPLASAVLQGASRSLVLDKLTDKQIEAAPKNAKPWNDVVAVIQNSVVELLERMQDFDSADLKSMFASPTTASVIFAMLFSGDAAVQQAATSMLKVATAESSRRDCIRFLLTNYYTTTLNAMSHTLGLIAKAKVLMPTLMVLKLGTDLIEVLCDTQEGLLRTRTMTKVEADDTERAWETLWTAISTMFEHTEAWSKMGYEKEFMKAFCRDAMDFADKSFDQYSVFSGALHLLDLDTDKVELDRRLLKPPTNAADHMVKWLRLWDEYLIGKAVSLADRVMGRLTEVELELSDDAINFIDDIVARAISSRLTQMQRAELKRALDKHTNEPEVEVIEKPPKKQGSLSEWAAPASNSTIDFDSWKSKAGQPLPPKQKVPGTVVKSAKFDKNGLMQRISARAPAPAGDFKAKRLQAQEERRKRDLAAIAAVKGARAAGVHGAGSGTSGVGVEGKAHGSATGLAVDSSEESDDGGLDEELFGPTAKQKKAPISMVSAKVEPKGPVILQRLQRSQKDMQARLKPDLSSLHQTILGWDLFHDNEYPPGSGEWQFQKVSPTFRHVDAYRNTFQPLLTLEAWQGFVQAREECSSKPFELKIVSRSNVDNFIEVSTALTLVQNKDLQMSEGDIILFSANVNPLNADGPHCLSRVHRVNRKKGVVEVIYRVVPTQNSMLNNLTPTSTIHGIKLTSITPLEREYGALVGLQYYDLCTQIIAAQPSPLLEYSDRQINPLMQTYSLNKAQAKAVRSAYDNDAFTLIQGPPGSGKTKTIVAIVGALIGDTINTAQSTNIVVPRGDNRSTAPPRKLLVCAPSNAAVDELVMRFKTGIRSMQGVERSVNVVRLGRSDAINTGVVDVTLDELVNKKLGAVQGSENAMREKTQALMKEHQGVSAQLRSARDDLDAKRNANAPHAEITRLEENIGRMRGRQRELGTQIDNAKDAEGQINRTRELQRTRVRQSVLEEAHVICATLSGSGHDMFQSLNVEFETVVVDEAAQCVEMSALIPLKYGCAKCILVGDPKQLPPTVFSKEAARFQYEQSLFVRMQGNFPKSVHLLDTQYRMHPDISVFPSTAFYDSRLLDGPNMAQLRSRPWHDSQLLAPYRFFNVEGQQAAGARGRSFVNRAEIDVALALYKRLTIDYPDYDFRAKVGIITPYKSQLHMLKDRFSAVHGQSILQDVEFNTTDAFQGRESEIIIFSCVRASPGGGIGFLKDIRRMNVGLTRAKSSLWVLGNGPSLMTGEYWRKLVLDAKGRNAYVDGNLLGMLSKPSAGMRAGPSASATVLRSIDRAPIMKTAVEAPQPIVESVRPAQSMTVGQPGVDVKSVIEATQPARSVVNARVSGDNEIEPVVKQEVSRSANGQHTTTKRSIDAIDQNETKPATSVTGEGIDSGTADFGTPGLRTGPQPIPRQLNQAPTGQVIKKRKPNTDVFLKKSKQVKR